ncbi:MAG: hypothetical protein Unbinned3138contig1000_52 [Prokaryotic dsDNA virus sp.]|nr:MAG: hypothetical protein Unbinned3138contig1000_52 [Prokaryotic dsDNA virus sp.]|tara:strand:- start:16751 stop:17038 length:288 start_codon:yes stop_codon:yes gene_type:complete
MTSAEIIATERHRSAQIDELVEHYRADSRWSVLWAFLLGPIYFAWHGFWGRAAVTLVVCLLFPIVGLIVAPLIVRAGWRERAEKRADRALTLNGI